jgi:hypothetical protein
MPKSAATERALTAVNCIGDRRRILSAPVDHRWSNLMSTARE